MSIKKQVIIICSNYSVSFQPASDGINNLFNLDFKKNILGAIKSYSARCYTIKLIAWDIRSEKVLSSLNLDYVAVKDYCSHRMLDESALEAINQVREFYTMNALNDRVSLFGNKLFQLSELYYYSFVQQLFQDISQLQQIISLESPDIVHFSDPNNVLYKIAPILEGDIRFFRSPVGFCSAFRWFFNKYIKFIVKIIFEQARDSNKLKDQLKENKCTVYKKRQLAEKGQVCIFTDELRHFPMIMPWASALLERNKSNTANLNIIGFFPWADQQIPPKTNFHYFYGFYGVSLRFRFLFNYIRYCSRWIGIQKGLVRENFLRFRGKEVYPYVRHEFRFLFFSYSYFIIREILIFNRISEKIRPGAIIVMDDRSWPGKTALSVAKNNGIPSVIIQHGLHNDSAFYGPSLASKLTVFGNYTREILLKHGITASQVEITGAPQWDPIFSITRNTEDFCRKYHLDKNKKIVLLATDIIFERTIGEKVLRSVLSAVRENHDTQLLIRAHPVEPLGIYSEIAEKNGFPEIRIFKKQQDYESIVNSDLIITQFSSVALEGMLIGKPVITINLSNLPDRFPFASEGAAMGVYDEDSLPGAIKKVLHNPSARMLLESNMKKFVEKHAYKPDGNASGRVADVILSLIKE